MRQLIEFTVNKIDRYVLMYLVAIVVLPRISNFSLHRASGFIGVNHGKFFSSYSFMHYSNKSYENRMEFLKSQKGKQKLAFEGYMYICDRKTENKTFWKCGSGLCRGRLITTHKDSEVEARQTKEQNYVK